MAQFFFLGEPDDLEGTARFVRALWSEITPTLTVPPDADVQHRDPLLVQPAQRVGLRC